MVKTMSEADTLRGAPYGECSNERTSARNGYRRRAWDIRAGTVHRRSPSCAQAHTSPIGSALRVDELVGQPASSTSPKARSAGTEAVGVFLDRTAIIRLVSAVLAEQSDERVEARRYMGLDVPAKARLRFVPGDTPAPAPIPQPLTD